MPLRPPLLYECFAKSVNYCLSYLLSWIVNSLTVGTVFHAFLYAFMDSSSHSLSNSRRMLTNNETLSFTMHLFLQFTQIGGVVGDVYAAE